ncbi:hypothetical protein BDP55DRAFT_636352 [Colletotrichum godetiae]|uniref:Uncharacterized protein n=1 Tax=Colletotrichum godetiae TaxID=1209918 RepID=A0AAJ0ET01_9PEZI|nr:uncharacterized protein BDP55DRAFT_636352 [Colletotrichum godetiae]KAK1660034.1 hypothetical protein BDP55DRAFT_636352 [Colletotrichum godetiae]
MAAFDDWSVMYATNDGQDDGLPALPNRWLDVCGIDRDGSDGRPRWRGLMVRIKQDSWFVAHVLGFVAEASNSVLHEIWLDGWMGELTIIGDAGISSVVPLTKPPVYSRCLGEDGDDTSDGAESGRGAQRIDVGRRTGGIPYRFPRTIDKLRPGAIGSSRRMSDMGPGQLGDHQSGWDGKRVGWSKLLSVRLPVLSMRANGIGRQGLEKWRGAKGNGRGCLQAGGGARKQRAVARLSSNLGSEKADKKAKEVAETGEMQTPTTGPVIWALALGLSSVRISRHDISVHDRTEVPMRLASPAFFGGKGRSLKMVTRISNLYTRSVLDI